MVCARASLPIRLLAKKYARVIESENKCFFIFIPYVVFFLLETGLWLFVAFSTTIAAEGKRKNSSQIAKIHYQGEAVPYIPAESFQ